MQVCGCVWHTTKSGGSFAGSVKPQSGQGAESVRMATSSRPGPWSLLGFWLWLQGKASAGLVEACETPTAACLQGIRIADDA
ncbi:hypothetical protein M431DRAFT_430100 [Trichoderma harzianum CBS 226.95]|uniref:Uncharacterized protein n=1 Tax=Trichoderma harzianum CBS 226.95 TaxID=983964 RepID=A0A2T4ACM2_TRIHA|nr:hypothetical protein M431DRAFT_430100 [Trichoderma harzianum CBS 226.95]PTB54821.1 hypothetical protein M431DRAFT_430100 [Trichoderma harzianum CBS 226.95]